MPRFGGQSLFIRERNIGIQVGSLACCGRQFPAEFVKVDFPPPIT
jgi:hypothetical protein